MIHRKYLLTAILVGSFQFCYSQEQNEPTNQRATTLGPGPVITAKPIKIRDKKTTKSKKQFALFSKQKTKSINDEYDRQIDEFYARMKDNAKRRKKEARLMLKPQYSDQSYFGHKRKPKKRKPGKRKFCKECQIIH